MGSVRRPLLALFVLINILLPAASRAGEYSFDISEIESKPYSFGGYLELRPVLFGLDRDAALYKLRFHGRDEGDTLAEYNAVLRLEGSLEQGASSIFVKTNTEYVKSYLGEERETTVQEGFISIKPSSSLSIDVGKKALRWGKGYAWNPVAFADRAKDPDEPELGLEGFILASAEYIKSLDSPLKTVSLTLASIPVYDGVNEDFGEADEMDLAGKLYLLLYDTDIDIIALAGGSRTTRYGADFSRNITANFEIHGEVAFINGYEKISIDGSGNTHEERYDAKSYLIGARYLTEEETTFILEYFRNGTGYTSGEMRDYCSFINEGYEVWLSTGSEALLMKAAAVTEGNYGAYGAMRDYLYFRASRSEPFGVLYFTPSVTAIVNADDRSFSLSPELLYTGVTNLQLRLKAAFIAGERLSEYGEKQNDYRLEFMARYYF